MSDGKKKTKTAFHAGTLYFRHGAKSGPRTLQGLLASTARY